MLVSFSDTTVTATATFNLSSIHDDETKTEHRTPKILRWSKVYLPYQQPGENGRAMPNISIHPSITKKDERYLMVISIICSSSFISLIRFLSVAVVTKTDQTWNYTTFTSMATIVVLFLCFHYYYFWLFGFVSSSTYEKDIEQCQ